VGRRQARVRADELLDRFGLNVAAGRLLLVFTSAAFVPATAMPGWLQAFGTHQPVDALVNAERALILGGPAAHDILISLAWSGGLLVVFALLAARTYARMGR
jgi:ABC-type multidrug transport system permease subunit